MNGPVSIVVRAGLYDLAQLKFRPNTPQSQQMQLAGFRRRTVPWRSSSACVDDAATC